MSFLSIGGFEASGWLSNTSAKRQLPAQPLVELGDQAEVERPAQDAHLIGRSAGERDIDLTEARVEEEALREDAVRSELVSEIIAHGQSG